MDLRRQSLKNVRHPALRADQCIGVSFRFGKASAHECSRKIGAHPRIGAGALERLDHQVSACAPHWQTLASLQERLPAWFLKRHDPTRPHNSPDVSQYRDLVAKRHQDVTPDCSIEWLRNGKIRNVGLREPNVFQPQFRHSSRRSGDGTRIAFGADDFPGGPDEAAGDQSDVTRPGAEVENTLSATDTRTTE